MGGVLYGPSGSQDNLNILIINLIINTGRVIRDDIKNVVAKISTLRSEMALIASSFRNNVG